MVDLQEMEDIADAALKALGVEKAPVPVDSLLQNAIPEFWDKLDVTQLSGSFLSIKHRFSPRMSLARMMARQIVYSPWGGARNLPEIVGGSDDAIRIFARMVVMPRFMLMQLEPDTRTNPAELEVIFEVPDDEAEKRIKDRA